MVECLTSELEKLRDERRTLQLALEQEEQNIQRSEGHLPAIKTQKEYVAVLKEIDTAKKLNKDIQDRIQAKDGEIAAVTRDREEKEQELADLTAKVSDRLEEIARQLAECESQVGTQVQDRDSLFDQLPLTLRKRYQLLFERRGGLAVVEARNGTCSGCNMHLPPQLFNTLFTVKEIQSCPHCNRLLYVTEPA
ncbi:MAG: C4-type zinc ribbon domain-containing protein, partial [Trichloromonas sp.]|jgi:predicted  nucleic acid-binding Zn-ribbon protein|nr:C4-type zinc ribbon domain-containing protein [Trichloromonas sp.]